MNPYQRAIAHFGETAQKEKAIEELKELIAELWCELQHSNYDIRRIVSEIADVQNMLIQLIMIYEIDIRVSLEMKCKMARTMGRIDKEEAAEHDKRTNSGTC